MTVYPLAIDKKCIRCGECKNINEFHKSKSELYGVRGICKICRSIESKEINKKLSINQKKIRNKRTRDWRKKQKDNNPLFYNEQYRKDKTALIRAKKYYYNNREAALLRMKTWRKNNREKMLFSIKNWKNNNKHLIKNYNEQNKLKYSLYANKRRALKVKATLHEFSKKELIDRMSVFEFKCAYCNGPFEHIDHVIPLTKGGPHCPSNLRPACRKCNCSKNNKLLKDWVNK